MRLPLGSRLCVHPLVFRMWASARVVQVEPWLKFWLLDAVCSSVEAWYSTAIDSEECLAGAVDVRLFVADVVRLFGSENKEVGDLRLCVKWSRSTCLVRACFF